MKKAMREWLKKSTLEVSGDEAQRKLHTAAEKYIAERANLRPGGNGTRNGPETGARKNCKVPEESRFLASLGMISFSE
jgi:hypothetical protein